MKFVINCRVEKDGGYEGYFIEDQSPLDINKSQLVREKSNGKQFDVSRRSV